MYDKTRRMNSEHVILLLQYREMRVYSNIYVYACGSLNVCDDNFKNRT